MYAFMSARSMKAASTAAARLDVARISTLGHVRSLSKCVSRALTALQAAPSIDWHALLCSEAC